MPQYKTPCTNSTHNTSLYITPLKSKTNHVILKYAIDYYVVSIQVQIYSSKNGIEQAMLLNILRESSL